MSFEQSSLSFEQRQPPTPTRTPTSPNYEDVFKTPKFESSFYDPRVTWNTADPNATSPNFLKTPRPLSFGTPTSKNAPLPSPNHFGRNLEAEFFTNAQNILATPDFSSLQVDQQVDTGQLPLNMSRGNGMDFSQPILPVDSSTSFRSASNMQTPPPTTTSASKRQGKQVQVGQADNEKGGSEKRRKSAPLLPKPTNNPNKIGASHASPDQFAGLEFSPDVFGPSFAAAPATAPADNQAKVFWDPQAVDSMSFDFTDLPFDTSRPGGLDPFVSNHPSISSSQATMQDSFLDFGNNDTPVASFSQSKLAPPNSQPGNMQNNTRSMHGVDPSLLFSSPGKLSDTINGSLPPGTSINQESLQPYAYQVQEARREREKAYGGVAKPKKRRKPSVDSPAVKAALETLREDGDRRPVVRRSMTDSVVSRHGQESGSSRTSSAHGRSSPLKRIKETRKSSRTPGHRTSIALTIDEHGRARAEARVIGGEKEGSEDAMDVDSVSTSSESSGESSSEPPGEEMVTSFAPQLPGPKMGRFSSSRAHSQKSSYTSFHSSMSYQDSQPSLPEIRPRPKSGSFANPLKTGSYTVKCRKDGKRITEDPESEAETVLDSDADEDNAKSQLRKVMQGRRSGSGPQPKHHLYSPLGISTAVFGSDNASSSISPTTITDPDLPTPTSSTSNQSDSIRCMCNSAMDEGQMIQCESCKKWLHVPCTGINPQRLPKIYLCLFCTGNTPAARGGRVRDPRRYVAQGSPLAQKSARFC